MNKKLTIYCDGGSRGNPGSAASAFVVMDGNNKIDSGAMHLGNNTNNMAEYTALLMAVEWIKDNEDKYQDYSFLIVMDSQLVVRQINGVYKIKNEKLKIKANEIQKLKDSVQSRIEILHVLRSKNTLADQLVNEKLDE